MRIATPKNCVFTKRPWWSNTCKLVWFDLPSSQKTHRFKCMWIPKKNTTKVHHYNRNANKKTLPPRLLFLTWRFSIRNNNQNASRDPLCVFWSRWSFPNPPCWSTQAVLENRWNTGGWNGGWEWPESPESWWGWFWVGWRWWCSVISIRKISKKKGRAYPRKDIIYIMIYIIGSPWGYSLNMNTAEYWLKWWLHMATIRYIYILNSVVVCWKKIAIKNLPKVYIAHLTWEGDDGTPVASEEFFVRIFWGVLVSYSLYRL